MKRPSVAAVVLFCLIIVAVSAFAAKPQPEPRGILNVVWQGEGVRIEASFECDWAMVSVTGDPIVVWGMGRTPSDFREALKLKQGHREKWSSAIFTAADGR